MKTKKEIQPCICGALDHMKHPSVAPKAASVASYTPTPSEIVKKLKAYQPINASEFSYVVRAVNAHEEMLDALRSVRNEYRAYVLNDANMEDAKGSRILAQIDRAIAKAEGK